MRLIDKDKLYTSIVNEIGNAHSLNFDQGLNWAAAEVISADVIEADPIRFGTWLIDTTVENESGTLIADIKCSLCNGEIKGVWGPQIPTLKYCAHCGAKMFGTRRLL